MNTIIFNLLSKIDWIADIKKRPMHYLELQINSINKELEETKKYLHLLEREKNQWLIKKNRIENEGVSAIDIMLPKRKERKTSE